MILSHPILRHLDQRVALLAGESRSNIAIGIQLINVGKIPGINEPLLLGEGDDLIEVLVLTVQRVVLGNPIGFDIATANWMRAMRDSNPRPQPWQWSA